MSLFIDIFFISIGAVAGALCRWGLALALNPAFPELPPGTLAANWLGSFLMGLALAALSGFPALEAYLRPAFVTGFLGSFTTFSTFAAEMGHLVQKGKFMWLFSGVLLHVAGSICLFLAGFWLVRAGMGSKA